MFDLLVCFLRHQNQIVDKDALIRAGWSDAFVTEDSLTHDNLMVVSLSGGPPRKVTSAIVGPNSGTWGREDLILVADSGRGIYTVSVRGGELTQLTSIDPGFETVHAWPQLLPGGRRFL